MAKVDSVQQRSKTEEKVVKLEKRNKELKAQMLSMNEKRSVQLKEAKNAADAAAFAMERMRAELEAVKIHNMRNTQDGDSHVGSSGQPLGDDILQEELQRVERENMAYQKRVRDLESGGSGPIDELRNELKVAQRQSRIFEETANDFKGPNIELTTRVAELEKEQSGSGRATEAVERLQNELETVEREKKLLEEKSSELEKRNFGLQTTVTTLLDENNQHSEAVMAVEEKKSMLEDLQADAAQRNKFLESKVVDLEEKVEWHVEEVESLQKQLELKEQAQAILVEQNEELESKVSQLNEDVGSWRAKASDASVAAASASSRSANSVKEDERFRKLQKEKSEMEKRNSMLESHLKTFDKEKNQWNKNVLEPVQKQNELLEERNAKVEQRNNSLEQKLADLETAKNALTSKEFETNHQQRVLEDKISQLEKQNHTLDSNVKRLEEEVVTWTSTAELAKKQTQLNNGKQEEEQSYEQKE
jgi:chromosome segregation ATPase